MTNKAVTLTYSNGETFENYYVYVFDHMVDQARIATSKLINSGKLEGRPDSVIIEDVYRSWDSVTPEGYKKRCTVQLVYEDVIRVSYGTFEYEDIN